MEAFGAAVRSFGVSPHALVAARPSEADALRGPLTVGVSVADPALDDRVRAALDVAGHGAERCGDIDGHLGQRFDCVITAAARADGRALAESRALRAQSVGGVAVMICRSASRATLRRALEQGLQGLVLELQLERGLSPTVVAACAGQVSVPSAFRDCTSPAVLTRRERQILALVVAERTNAEIASEVFLAESTVKSHLSSAFSKLGVSSRNEAARVICDPELGRGLGIRRPVPESFVVADS